MPDYLSGRNKKSSVKVKTMKSELTIKVSVEEMINKLCDKIDKLVEIVQLHETKLCIHENFITNHTKDYDEVIKKSEYNEKRIDELEKEGVRISTFFKVVPISVGTVAFLLSVVTLILKLTNH